MSYLPCQTPVLQPLDHPSVDALISIGWVNLPLSTMQNPQSGAVMRTFSIGSTIENVLSRCFDANYLKSMLPAISHPELRLSLILKTHENGVNLSSPEQNRLMGSFMNHLNFFSQGNEIIFGKRNHREHVIIQRENNEP